MTSFFFEVWSGEPQRGVFHLAIEAAQPRPLPQGRRWAAAQAPSVEGPPPSAFGPDPIIQITTTFRARIEGLADPRDVPTTAAQDAATLQHGCQRVHSASRVLESRMSAQIV